MYNPLIDKIPYGAAVKDEKIVMRFPVPKNMGINKAFVILRQVHGEEPFGYERIELPLKKADKNGITFEGEFSLNRSGVWNYRFEGELEDGSLAFFGRGQGGCALRADWLPEWQLTVSKCAYKTPDWAKCGVIYQIFADRFCRVDGAEFKKKGRLHTYWNDRPDIASVGGDYRADDFFGGNAKGIISKLDYLKSLGVTCIYLSPIFKSSSNHRYDTGDYLEIDELFGTEDEFKELVSTAKEKGIKIILDGVFNHTGADSKYFNRFGNYPTLGAYQSKDSEYFDWYYFSNFPNLYHCWWGSTVVPTVNKSAEGYRRLLMGEGGIIDKWSKAGISGWRLDVVDELPVDFTTELCGSIKSHGSDMLIVGEVWEDASVKIAYDEWRPYFMGGQLDSVMNYPFKEAILKYTMTGDASEFADEVSKILEHYPKQSLDTLMNLIDSHDTVRALTYLSGVNPPDTKLKRAEFKLNEEQYALAKARLEFASALQFTLPGVPCVFYGDEAGAEGFEDPLNRGTYPWGSEDKELLKHYTKLGRMREQYADYLLGETVFVEAGELLVFERRSEKGILRVYANAGKETISRPCSGIDVLTGKEIKSRITVKPLSVRIVVL